MRAIIVVLLVFMSVAVTAQGWSKLNDQFLDLYNNGDFEKAIPVGEKAKLAAQKEFGLQHSNYALSLYNLAGAYLGTGNYKKAEPLYLQAKALQQKILGDMDPDYGSTLSDLATLYVETKQYAKAEPLYLQAKKISEKTTTADDPEYITIVENLAQLYSEMKLYEKAEPLYLQSHEFYKIHPGENKADYESSLNNLTLLYDDWGLYAKAEDYYWSLAALYKESVGEMSNQYAHVINRLALNYSSLAQYEKADTLYYQHAVIRFSINGPKSPEYASALNNLASHYVDIGLYEKAAPLYEQAASIAEQNPDKKNTEFLTYVNNYATLYTILGKYDIAEPLLVKLVAAKKAVFGENAPEYAVSLNSLANIYFKTSQYDKAAQLDLTAINVLRKWLNGQTPENASTLNNLALVYTTTGEWAKAEPLFLESKMVWEKLGLQSHPDYAALLDNLGLLYTNMGNYAKTKAFYLQAISVRKKVLGEIHPDYATSLNNLAYYFMYDGQNDSAEIYFNRALNIIKNTLGEEHPSYGTILNSLSNLYIKMGKFGKAEPLLLQAGKIVMQTIRSSFTVLSEEEKNNFLENNAFVFETANNFLFRNSKASETVATNSFNLQLVLKSAALSDTRNMIETLENSKDSSIRKLFSDWTVNRNILSKQYALPAASRRKDIAAIAAQTEEQEKDLNRLSTDFNRQQSALQVVMKDVQGKLAADEAAVEFVRFSLTNVSNSDSVMYAAYIVRKNSTAPLFVPLCEEKQLLQLFEKAGNSPTAMVNHLYRGLGAGSTGNALEGSALYQLIWQPLEPYLKDAKKIAYSPAGKLYSIAFKALPVDSVTILSDRYQLQQYTSTREISFRGGNSQELRPSTVTLFGNASFTMDSAQLANQKRGISKTDQRAVSVYTPVKTRGNGVWNDLPGTALEVNAIKKLLDDHTISAQVYVQMAASEDNLKKPSGTTRSVLHIATHGFFLPAPSANKKRITNGNEYMTSENPLLRSGIVLAGGNYVWSGKKPVPGVEDGIVTAYEISQMDLRKTGLVVLSACETALGDIKGAEGVFGLQRAFKMAGVKKMIVSLWQVPDRETAELMTLFYSYWIDGKTLEEAFNQAQAALRKKYTAYYWAAFVLIE